MSIKDYQMEMKLRSQQEQPEIEFSGSPMASSENTGKKESTISSAPIQAPTSAPAPDIDQFPPDVSMVLASPAPAPAIEDLLDDPVLARAPAPVVGESDNGYGLFSEDSGTFPRKETSTTATTTTTTTTANENELLKEELDGVHFNKKYENGNYNNNGYSSNYNNKAYKVDSGNQNSNGFTSNNGDNGYKLAGESKLRNRESK
ncbi:hypothetical protein OIU74_015539 [Salix koriyanagi]|uniref:Uncharacterized protein n=1 Tax=Salix koriyanagi TaxID=2511006 RepID=A0A9Q0PMI7_9ROSI|nr:hypothetical protein OIU74_015539 [Salix koriyanagi]